MRVTGSNEGATRTTTAAVALARQGIELDRGFLAHGDRRGVLLVDGDEHAQAIDAHDGDDGAAARGTDQSARDRA